MPVLRSARALAEAPITIVKKNPKDAIVKSLQDQLAAVSSTSARSDLISFSSRSFWACAAASWSLDER